MRFRTHVMLGISLFLILDLFYGIKNKIVVFVLILLFSVLPDIDLHTSYIGKKVKGFSYLFEFVLKHRGFIHSVWIPILLFTWLEQYGLGIAVAGYLSHLGLDLLTSKGIKLFWPWLKIKGPFVTGKLVDNMLFFMLLGLNLFLIIYALDYIYFFN